MKAKRMRCEKIGMTEQDHFSILRRYSRLKDVLGTKAKEGMKSRWICETLLKEYDSEVKAQQSLDDVVNDQRRKENQNKRVEDFITMIHRDGDWQELMKKFDLEQLLRLKAEVGVYYEQIDAAVHFEVDRQERDRKFLASTHRFERSNRGRYDSNME